jgi:hypothetical protein
MGWMRLRGGDRRGGWVRVGLGFGEPPEKGWENELGVFWTALYLGLGHRGLTRNSCIFVLDFYVL